MLKTLKTTTLAGLAALTLTSTLSLQANAQSSAQFSEVFLSAPQHFDTRKTVRRDTNSNDQGAGSVIGSQVSGNGARVQGSVLGALIGGTAGAAIADNHTRSRQFDHYRSINSTHIDAQTYRNDFGYKKYSSSEFEGYNRRGFYNDNVKHNGTSASGLPYYKGFGTHLGPHGSTKRTSLLGRRF